MTDFLFLDTEFNGFGGSLISIGISATNGREFYAVVDVPKNPHPWVAENVIPHLGAAPIGLNVAKLILQGYLRGFSQPVVVADWPEDLSHFFQMLLGHEPGMCLARGIHCSLVDLPKLPSEIPHNALSDARALRAAWEMLSPKNG